MCRTFIKTFNIYALCCLVGSGMLLACDCLQITHAQVWFMDVMNVCVAHMQSNHCARIRIKLNGLCIFCYTRLFTVGIGPICFSIVTRVKYVIWRCVFTLQSLWKLILNFHHSSPRRRLLFSSLATQTLSNVISTKWWEFFISKCVIHFVIPCMSFTTTSSLYYTSGVHLISDRTLKLC